MQTYDCNGVPCPTGVNFGSNMVSFNQPMPDRTTFSLKLTATWTVGNIYPQVYTDSIVINIKTASLWTSAYISKAISPTTPLDTSTFKVP